jgi:hypothetical protein
VAIGEIAQDFARFRRLDLHVVQRHHPLDGFFPPFGRRAAERNARQAPFVVRAMAARALLPYELIGDGDALVFLCFVLGRGGWCGRRRLLRDQRHVHQERKGRQAREGRYLFA